MPDFQPHVFDHAACRQQVQELKALLDSSPYLGEAIFHDFFEPTSKEETACSSWEPMFNPPARSSTFPRAC